MNIVSRTRIILIAAALPLVAAPAFAEPMKADALDACVKAFVSSNFEKERRYSVVTSDSSHFDPQSTTYRIALTATGKDSGRKLAKATCIVDRKGVELTANGKTVPAVAETATLSAR